MGTKSSKHIHIIKCREIYNDSQVSIEENKYFYDYLSMNKRANVDQKPLLLPLSAKKCYKLFFELTV